MVYLLIAFETYIRWEEIGGHQTTNFLFLSLIPSLFYERCNL